MDTNPAYDHSAEELDDDGRPVHPADELVDRCQALFDELDTFHKYLRREAAASLAASSKKTGGKKTVPNNSANATAVELRHFKNAVQLELRSLEALSYRDPTDEKVKVSIRSSNLPFLEAVWATAKRCRAVEGISKTVYYYVEDGVIPTPLEDEQESDNLVSKRSLRTKKKKLATMVDIVAQSGLEWIKVSSIGEQRLAFEAAGEGVGFNDDDDEDDEEEDEERSDGEVFSLVRMAKTLVKAASQVRVQYLNPNVTVVLSNISTPDPDSDSPSSRLVSNFISKLLATGVRVQTKSDILTQESSTPPQPVESVLKNLAPSFLSTALSLVDTSDTINVDCTVLLALVSDISHLPLEDIPRKPYLHSMVLRQLEAESVLPVLTKYTYPLCSGKKLVTTKESAQRFWEIVSVVGSDSEKMRAGLILPFLSFSDKATFKYNGELYTIDGLLESNATKSRIELLQSTSRHPLPPDFDITVKVIQSCEDELMEINSVASAISTKLSKVNRSVLYTGWHRGWTTLSSNGSVVKRLEQMIEEQRSGGGVKLEGDEKVEVAGSSTTTSNHNKMEEFVGPRVVLIPMSRSLVGTPKKCWVQKDSDE